MSLRILAHPQWLSLGRFAWPKHEVCRRIALSQRHSFVQPNQKEQKDVTNFFTPPDTSLAILEHSTAEYKDVASEFAGVNENDANKRLQQLACNGDWPTANRLRMYMANALLPIHPSFCYEDAAISFSRTENPHQHVDEFASWLSLVPDAEHAGADGFQRLLEEIRNKPAFIGPCGLVLSAKGYLDLVRSRIVPVLSRTVESDLREQYLRAFEQEAIQFTGKALHPAQESISHKHTPADQLLLEEMDEYTLVNVKVDSTHTTAHMEHLVADGQYHAARLLRNDFEELEIPIPPSPIYAEAAKHSLTRRLDYAALRKDIHADDDLASAEFMSWFSLVPNVSQSRDNLGWLHDTCHHFLATPRTNIPALTQFGIICAEKGYSSVAGQYIIPIIVQLSPQDASFKFFEQFVQAAKSGDAVHGQHGAEKGADYMRLFVRAYARAGYLDRAVEVMQRCDAEGVQLPPSTYDYVLRQLRARPKRAAVLTPLVRAARARWYAPVHVDQSPQSHTGSPPKNELVDLILADQFEEATRLLLEWHGPKLTPDHWYSYPAELALRYSELQGQQTWFEAWFSLIPDAPTSIPRNFSRIKSLLLPMSSANSNAVMSFALACVRKGYWQAVLHDVIPSIIKVAHQQDVAPFLELFIAETRAAVLPKYPAGEINQLTTRLIDVCIRGLCDDRQPVAALKLVRSQQALCQARPSFGIMKMLTGVLSNFHGSDKHPDVVHARRLSEAPVTKDSSQPTNLVADLRYWRNLFSSRNKQFPVPHYSSVIQFIQDYLAIGRNRALTILHRKALSTPRVAVGSAWIYGEMLYYHNRGQHALVIVTFSRYFALVGVPRLSILQLLQNWEEEVSNLHQVAHFRGRALPTGKHVALVWASMIELADDRATLSALYNQFRQELRLSQGAKRELHMRRSKLIGDTVEAPHPPPALLFNREIFTHFLGAFCRRYSPGYGVRVLLDMVRMRLSPSVEQLSILASSYARQGNADHAVSILEFMRNGNSLKQSGAMPERVGMSPIEKLKANLLASNFSIPPPDLTAYAMVTRELLEAGRIHLAEEVYGLARGHYNYRFGSDADTDVAIASLRAQITQARMGSQYSFNGHANTQQSVS